ncbi:hypothetical protein IDSA_00055 [Pseudidiomarina salinarum]|uniref:MSHA biogenesis protein MshI n=1 Tax=Pseudidiomarina salinarum TaxID=435908 RepID=A0A094IVK8_9GAMM|nr:hypothetical protein [Pseudidiomarina salinarum]KFZ31167.1 hypothetical protein IDSA_00055 [Pseudidiomarina salinarum]RUO71085.1 hypothetical protein CWI79_06515 [Pseudidiomarina salinarum]
MLKWLWAKKTSDIVLTFALSNESVGVVITQNNRDTPELIVSDSSGKDDRQFADVINELLTKYSRYSRGDPGIILVLAPSLYQSVALERPKLPDEEIAAGLRYSLRDLVSLPPANIIADYYELPVQLPGQNKINAVVADRKLLTPIIEALQSTSDNILAVIAEEQAVARLFEDQLSPAVVVYQSQQEPALLQVYRDGKLQVNRSVAALEKLSALSSEEMNMGALQPLSVEIQRSIDYFERQLRQRPVKEVVLALSTQPKKLVTDQLTEDLGVDIRWAKYPDWTHELATGDYIDFPAFGGALIGHELKAGDQ